MFDQFADAFEQADVLILADIYAAREKDIYEISSEKLAEAIKKEHPGKKVMNRYNKKKAGVKDE